MGASYALELNISTDPSIRKCEPRRLLKTSCGTRTVLELIIKQKDQPWQSWEDELRANEYS